MRSVLFFIGAVACGAACAQEILPNIGSHGTSRLLTVDSAVLDLREPRNDFSCVVAPIRPEIGFDLRFHAGYAVSLPMSELEGGINRLTIIFRVSLRNAVQEPVYFIQKVQVPAIPEGSRGRTSIGGGFRLGEGEYYVDWLMRDQNERFCASSWDLVAKVNGKENAGRGPITQNLVEAEDPTLFADESPVERDNTAWHVRILVNFAAQDIQSSSLGNPDLDGLVGILRKINAERRIARYSLVALSIQTQQVVYRQDAAPSINMPALGKALKSLNLGIVHLKQLAAKNSETEFLEQVLGEEIGKDHIDAVIFVGPKYYLDTKVSQAAVNRLGAAGAPVFYMNYNSHPSSRPWRDALGKVVRQLHGVEYGIGRPLDICGAWEDIVSRILAKKPALETATQRPGH